MSLVTLCIHTVNCNQLLISGDGQLLGNDDGVEIPLWSALPVRNSDKSFQCMIHGIIGL